MSIGFIGALVTLLGAGMLNEVVNSFKDEPQVYRASSYMAIIEIYKDKWIKCPLNTETKWFLTLFIYPTYEQLMVMSHSS